ncbi:MAG: hypothetical protein J5I90_18030 [Caldilineales bacterium]|nr:hypothetical protein [Caldilineales bacterium]
MARRTRYVFLLWGAQFDEASAAIFVSELRSAGALVKVVGLRGQHITGAHGVALKPDIHLDDALRLAGRTACLIIPADISLLAPFAHDPRLLRFLADVRDCGARIVAAGAETAPGTALIPPDEMTVYPTGEAIFEFIRELSTNL